MSNKRKKTTEPTTPRQVGEYRVTEPVVKRRRSSKRKPNPQQTHLWEQASASPFASEPIQPTQPRATDGRSAADIRGRRPAAAGGLFQSIGHCCDKNPNPTDLGEAVGWRYRICPCPQCGPYLGSRLRQRLLYRVQKFTHVFGVTLTVDGSLFDSPLETWQYVMDNRLLARLVRELLHQNQNPSFQK
jgi:hypothetical protein